MAKTQYDYPFPKVFEKILRLNITANKKKEVVEIKLKYPQSTMAETLKFIQNFDGTNNWLLNFLNEFGDMPENLAKIMFLDEKIINKIGQEILDTHHKGAFAKGIGTQEKGRGSIFSSAVVFLMEKLHFGKTPREVMDSLTFEEWVWLQNGLLFNARELTDDGKKKNDYEFLGQGKLDGQLLQQLDLLDKKGRHGRKG